MKQMLLLIVCSILSVPLSAQSINGAWESTSVSDTGETLKQVLIFADGYYAATTYTPETGAFLMTSGGSYTLDGHNLTQTLEFDTQNPERVGTTMRQEVKLSDTKLSMSDGLQLTRIDNGAPGALQGAWLMSGRVRDGNMQERDTSGPRKTMKILSGTRFQWIAYNTDTKQFMGTGGGTYTTVDGKYTERIQFFSRDNSRVGNSLQFDYELKDGHWHHQGLSSKGDPLHEIWSLRN